MINNAYLDNITFDEIIEYSLTFKNEAAGRKWCESILAQKARREVELKEQEKQSKKHAEFRRFVEIENRPDRISRTDEQKERTAKIFARKYDLNLDELIAVQVKAYKDDLKRQQLEEQEQEILDFGFEELER